MKYPRYVRNEFVYGHYEYITPCPYGQMAKTGSVCKVGGQACQLCRYFKDINTEARTVACAYK